MLILISLQQRVNLQRLLREEAEKNYEVCINCFIERYGYHFGHGDSVLIGSTFLA